MNMKIKIKLEMGLNRNSISYNCNIKELRTKFTIKAKFSI